MHTLKLQISDSIYSKLLAVLNTFDKSELQIIEEDMNFAANKKYIIQELERLDANEAKFVSLDELNDSIDKVIKKYES